ncbi:MAG: 50S ribosomal protein L15 [Oscillospiraceae bacterium]|jgi:large subunit ribosomal protein L15|nr:50S ribosomal protein L15 [Oscillospiraceae bacterium]
MEVLDLKPKFGAKHVYKRIGRGHGSGNGKTAGKGHKGQKARSGAPRRVGFEGGQMPLQRRIPKRGFNNIFALSVEVVNLNELCDFEENSVIDAEFLIKNGIIKRKFDKLKILGDGELSKKFKIIANMFSKSALKKIHSAGGIAEVI